MLRRGERVGAVNRRERKLSTPRGTCGGQRAAGSVDFLRQGKRAGTRELLGA